MDTYYRSNPQRQLTDQRTNRRIDPRIEDIDLGQNGRVPLSMQPRPELREDFSTRRTIESRHPGSRYSDSTPEAQSQRPFDRKTGFRSPVPRSSHSTSHQDSHGRTLGDWSPSSTDLDLTSNSRYQQSDSRTVGTRPSGWQYPASASESRNQQVGHRGSPYAQGTIASPQIP